MTAYLRQAANAIAFVVLTLRVNAIRRRAERLGLVERARLAGAL